MWKTLAGRCLYQSSDGIQVFQNPLYRWLQFDSNALQTVLNRYAPQRPQLPYIESLMIPVQLQPDNCCMLGLGGGGVAHTLDPILKNAKLDIVEKNHEVIEIAKRFFWVDRLHNINLIHDDAEKFLKTCQIKYQHLLVDIYTDDSFPRHCANADFFASCKKQLKPDGILAVNLANSEDHYRLFKMLQSQFTKATVALIVPGTNNMIIFAQNSPTINLFLTLLKKTKKIKKLIWTERWGLVMKLN
ncbi:MAG: fused MFS/spermidine synthase [Tatlockia sp.]|nr:fused MFS/spermidine synthase [Tatlockia sp.]